MRHHYLLFASALLAQPAVAALGDNSVGMNIHVGRQTFVDACADLGVSWVRVDANWFSLEPSQDSYSWGYLDDGVARARAAGLEVYVTLAYTPEWLPRHGDTDGDFHNDVPDDSTEWVEFVTDAVTRYSAQGVTHFGIWNEPNLRGFFEGTTAEYVDLILVPGAAAVRAACPSCLVLGPDLAHVGGTHGDPDDILEEILASAPGAFDIVAHHSYNGFPETGVEIWDNDRFFEVLDQQRFFFTRRSLRQVLDAVGYAGEVWITETGYRASPPGDAGEEALQEVYLTRVLEEQLLRAWYTNTFFYEILDCGPDQPDCDIDGYGLMRATAGSPGSRTFPDDFRLKPAFLALRQYIADHPELSGQGSAPACGDGDDNDGDGRTDLADRGCTGPGDDDEGDDPPRQRLVALPATAITVDGDLGDWGADGWTALDAGAWAGTEPLSGAGDLVVRAALRWSAAGLLVAVEVTDDQHENEHAPADLWQGDSLQLGFDVGQSGGTGYDDLDDHELNFALSAGATSSYRFHGPTAADDGWSAVVQRVGTTTSYELLLPPSALPSLSLQAGVLVGFSFLVNDADGAGRVGWLEWTPGIGMTKEPEFFGEILLAASATDGGVVADAAGVDTQVVDGGQDAARPDAAQPDLGGRDAAGTDGGTAVQDAAAPDARRGDAAGGDAAAGEGDGDGGCGCATRSQSGGAAGAALLLGTLWLGCAARRRPGARRGRRHASL